MDTARLSTVILVDPRVVPTLDLVESTRHFVLSFLESSQYAALAGSVSR